MLYIAVILSNFEMSHDCKIFTSMCSLLGIHDWAETNILINIREHSINTAIIQLGILPCFVFVETCSIHTW